jgi:hypothetical protein
VKDVAIQMVRRTVIAEVEAKDIEASLEQVAAERKNIEGIRVAFPAVEQHYQRTLRLLLGYWVRRMQSHQSHTIATVQDVLLGTT